MRGGGVGAGSGEGWGCQGALAGAFFGPGMWGWSEMGGFFQVMKGGGCFPVFDVDGWGTKSVC